MLSIYVWWHIVAADRGGDEVKERKKIICSLLTAIESQYLLIHADHPCELINEN